MQISSLKYLLSPLRLARPLIIVKQRIPILTRLLFSDTFAMWDIRALAAAGVLVRIAMAADFDWTAIEPSEQLKYHPCYDGLQCARLSVPYD